MWIHLVTPRRRVTENTNPHKVRPGIKLHISLRSFLTQSSITYECHLLHSEHLLRAAAVISYSELNNTPAYLGSGQIRIYCSFCSQAARKCNLPCMQALFFRWSSAAATAGDLEYRFTGVRRRRRLSLILSLSLALSLFLSLFIQVNPRLLPTWENNVVGEREKSEGS
jgi:hypothetical protein